MKKFLGIKFLDMRILVGIVLLSIVLGLANNFRVPVEQRVDLFGQMASGIGEEN